MSEATVQALGKPKKQVERLVRNGHGCWIDFGGTPAFAFAEPAEGNVLFRSLGEERAVFTGEVSRENAERWGIEASEESEDDDDFVSWSSEQ